MKMSKSKTKLKGCSYCCLCSNIAEVYGFGSCFHPICYRCSTKLRVLNNDKKCPLCDQVLEKVIFTTSIAPLKTFDTSLFIKDDEYGIWCETDGIRMMFKNLLYHKCPESGCNKKYINFIHLRHHCNAEHKKYFCPLCLKTEHVFTDERQIYSNIACLPKGKHREGGNLIETSELWEHSASEHFVCSHSSCVGHSKSIFQTEKGLQDHLRTMHASNMSKSMNNFQAVISPWTNHGRFTPIKTQLNQVETGSNQSDDEIRGNGFIVNISTNFGFIEREGHEGDFSENVFFNNQSCGISFYKDLSEIFNEGDRVYFQAKTHSHRNKSKWRATQVKLVSNSPRTSQLNGNVNHSHAKKLNNKTNLQTVSNSLKGIGIIHCNLGPNYGFIIRQGNDGGNYKENVYFSCKSLQLGLNRPVYDLTAELNINEKVGYELEEPQKSSYRPANMKYRAIKVWKIDSKQSNERDAVAPSIPTRITSPQPVLSQPNTSSNLSTNYTGSLGSVYGSAMNGNDAVYEESACSQDSFYGLSFNVDSLNIGTNEIEVFRKVLQVIMGHKKNTLINDFDMELSNNRLTMTQIAYVHFNLLQSPKVYSVLMDRNPQTGDHQNHASFILPGSRGFDPDAFKRLIDDHVILPSDDDDLYYVENSAAYVMVVRDISGELTEIFLHANFTCM